jgi:hypothetical protein
MTTTRDDLHARIDHLPDEQLDHAAALLDELADAGEPLPPGHAAKADDAVKSLFAHRAAQQARALHVANNTESTPLPLALEALGDYVGARPGLTSDLLAHEPDAETDPVGAALVDDQQRQLAGYTRRDWRALTLEQKAAAVAANTKRWR